ncbi:MAG: type II secretion system protein GspG [Planctomycetota bacterium]
MNTRTCFFVLFVVLSFFSFSGKSQSLPKLLPPQTFALITFQDLRDLEAKQLKTVWGQFCQLPGAQEFFRNWSREFKPFLSFMDQWIREPSGVTFEEIFNLLEGEISVAFLNLGPSPIFMAFLEKGNPQTFLLTLMEKNLGNPRIEAFGEETLRIYPERNREIIVCAGNSGLWISNSMETMKQVLQKRQRGDPNNLTKTAIYQKHRTGNERLFMFLNPEMLFATAPQESRVILEALGIFGCDGVSLSYGYEGDHLVGRSRLSFRETPIGLFSPSHSEGLQPESLTHLRGHLVSATACSFSFKAWLNLLHQFLTTLPPKDIEEYKKMSKDVKSSLGLTLEEFAALFGDTFSSWQFKRESATESLYAIELRSPQTLLSLFPKLEQAPYITLLKREYKGTPIYQINLETNQSEEIGAVVLMTGLYFYGIPTNFIIHKNQLILATLPHTLQDYLDLQTVTGEGPLNQFAQEAKGKQFFSLAYHPKETAENYRDTLHFVKRFETLFRTFGIPLDIGTLPRATEILSLIKPNLMQMYFANNCLIFEFKVALPLGMNTTTLVFGGVSVMGIGSAIAIPNFLKTREQAEKATFMAQIKMLEAALRMYESDYGKFPPEGDENLVVYLDGNPQNGGPKMAYFEFISSDLEGNLFLDFWRNPYHYRLTRPVNSSKEDYFRIYLWSNGPNGIDESGEGDDIKNWD